jgi:hypothetical protein
MAVGKLWSYPSEFSDKSTLCVRWVAFFTSHSQPAWDRFPQEVTATVEPVMTEAPGTMVAPVMMAVRGMMAALEMMVASAVITRLEEQGWCLFSALAFDMLRP